MTYGFFGENYGRPAPGSRMASDLNFDAILEADGKAPWQLRERGTYRPNAGPIDLARYFDPKYVELEIEHIWKKQWQVACREEDIPNVGDRIRYDIANMSFMIVRSAPDDFKAFYNSCPHRARSLCDHKGQGKAIQCQFHGWTWNLDGSMEWLPSEQDFPFVDKKKYSLPEVQVARWGGHVFINPDQEAAPLDDYLGVLKTHFVDFPLEERYTATFVRKRFDANWKIAQEAFLEAYHMVETHWDALPFSGDTATLYDCWDEDHVHIDRLTTPMVVPSGWFDGIVSTETALKQFLAGSQLPTEFPEGSGETLADARRYAAAFKRKTMKEAFGRDLDDAPNSYMLDACRYLLYPNFHPWWGEGTPLWYRFLPDGMNPASSFMEVRVLLPISAGQERPAAAEPIHLDAAQRWADVPELGFLGHILDQDTLNIAEIQKGAQAAAPDRSFLTLARQQESSIAHFHEYYGRILQLR